MAVDLPVPITALFAALHAVLIYVLAGRVSRMRMKHRVSFSDGGVRELGSAIRAHGNGVEHTPIVLLLMLIYELNGGNATLLWVMGAVFLLARLAYSGAMLGILHFRVRQITAAVTYLVPMVFAVLLIMQVVG